MKKQYAAAWVFVLLLSLSLILVLVVLPKQHDEPPATVALMATTTPRSLIFAPTRFLPTVAAAPSATMTPLPPTPFPTMTTFAVTLAAPEPRVFQAANIANSGSMLFNYCTGFGSPVAMRIYDWSTGSTISLSDTAIAQIPLSWDASNTIWQGYNSARPFNQPNDAQERWKINLYLTDGSERWIQVQASQQVQDVYYVYSFEKIIPFSGADGQHYGYHPCRAFTISAEAMQRFLNVVNQYQDAIRYPALIGGNDPRWTYGLVSPVSAYADFRSIPSMIYNDPIGSIDKPVKLWFALDPTWNGWAQVRIGSTQGWVELALVDFTQDR
ncbi:MAG: hypothetical protein ABI700_21190 [Chloroflexota bacterium]